MQKAIIVQDGNMNHLNDFLNEGWKVVSMCPMPSSVTGDNLKTVPPTCLVIVEKM